MEAEGALVVTICTPWLRFFEKDSTKAHTTLASRASLTADNTCPEAKAPSTHPRTGAYQTEGTEAVQIPKVSNQTAPLDRLSDGINRTVLLLPSGVRASAGRR